MRDLSFGAYDRLLQAAVAGGFQVGGVEDYLRGDLGETRVLILRHDVDRRPAKSVAMAELETARAVRATYYFRAARGARFPERAIERIATLGHRIGYHYEDLADCHGDWDRAVASFGTNLSRLRQMADCQTVCRHGSPFSRHDNLELMRGGRWLEYGLLGDAVLSFEGRRTVYLTDTGGQWGAAKAINVRDRQHGAMTAPGSRTTQEVTEFLERSDAAIYLNVHPERWSSGPVDGMICRAVDGMANLAKRLRWAIRRG